MNDRVFRSIAGTNRATERLAYRDIHGPASVQKELQLFVGHFEDVSAV